MRRSEQSRRDRRIAFERKTTAAGEVARRHGVSTRTVRRAVRRVEREVGRDGMIGIDLMARQKARLESANDELSRLRGRHDDPELLVRIVSAQLEVIREEVDLARERGELGLL